MRACPVLYIVKFARPQLQARMSRLPSPINCPNSVTLPVLAGRCPHLTPTGETVLVDRRQLSEDLNVSGLQSTKSEHIFWLISNNQRLLSMCYCAKCEKVFNGAGSNVRNHVARHDQRREFTDADRQRAFFTF